MRFLLFILSIFLCQSVYSQDTITIKAKTAFATDYIEGNTISIIDLISNPEKYHGKRVQLIGFLNVEFEGTAIYFHQEDFNKSITKNGIWVSFDNKMYEKINNEDLNQTYVILAGTFNMKEKGHFGLWSGYIGQIYRLNKWN